METHTLAGFRLSPQQERLWPLLEDPGEKTAYRAQCLVAIEGRLDRTALAAALARLVERHELLRTSFQLLPGLTLPLQVVGDAGRLALEERELGGADEAAEAVFAAALEAPFDPQREAPLSALLLIEAPDRHLLLLTMPSLVADAAGLENMTRELALAYGETAGAPRARDGEEPIQYADLAEWQHELLESEDTREGREYWKSCLAALPELDPLAMRATGAFSPRAVRVPLPAGLPESLAALAAARGVPIEDVLLAAWHALLSRLTGRPDLALGVVFDGRRFDELRGALGLFARTLPLQSRLDEDLAFTESLARVHRTRSEHALWQEYFPPKEPAPLAFGFEAVEPPRPHRAGGAAFTAVRRYACCERFTAKLIATGLDAKVHYDEGRLPQEAAELLAERFATLLAGAVERPDAALEGLPLLGPRERRLIAGWNETRVELPGARLLHRLVADQAARSPGRIAVTDGDERLTYAELAERSARLARRLRSLGAAPETRVAVCIERSLDMVVALLGVLQAGAAYVPLDPSYPRERLRLVLEDARPAVLVVGRGAPASLAWPDARRLDLASEEENAAAGAAEEAPDVTPDHLAYVIYTSGSTGRPKGVMVPHRAIVNRLLWMQGAFPLTADDRVLQKTPFGFDASIWEIFVPLLAGARLVLARPDGHQDTAYLARAVAGHGITVLQLVPSLLAAFLEEDLAGCAGLARLFCGGEELPAELRDRALARLPAALCNLYGPTECAIDATFWPCERGDRRAPVPIGRPIANVRAHLLDARGNQVPAGPLGMPGELHIGGAGLARGYLGRPDLTAERFVPDPWSSEPGGRLYRTGDLARYGLDGILEYLGRADQQVKVRGFRVEPGEVESCLLAHPAVAEAAVAGKTVAGEQRLVAWIVPRLIHGEGESPSAEELRAFLAARLPDPMVPSAFVRLRVLPRLPNGKLDRNALPEPDAGALAYVAPRTPTEEVLAACWAELLGVERLGAHDNVFDLGWHSLIATRFASRLRRTFGVELPMRSLFENPTVASLAERIDAALRGGTGMESPPIRPVPREKPLPLSFAQRRLWFLDQWQPGSPFYNIPTALRLAGRLDVAALARSLAEIARRHESLRTTFAVDPHGEPAQVVAPPGPVALPVIDLAGLLPAARQEEAHRLIAEEALRPFDLARGPLLRVSLLRLGAEEHAGLLTMHHIVSDGWSTAVLTSELAALYSAFVEDRPADLPELPIQYADFSVWQREWMRGEVLEAHVAYWRRQLAGAPPVLELPGDRPRPAVQTFRGAVRVRRLAPEVLEELRGFARKGARGEGATLFMVLVAAGKVLLGWTAGVEDVVIGTDVASRERPEMEGLIGFFINQLALRTRLSGDPTFRELLARVREVTLGAYAHQALPFDKLVEILNPERSRSHTPLFQVKINLHNVPPPVLELPGLTLEPLPMSRETAQFDWILSLIESEQGLVMSLEHSTDLFDPATIDRMLGNYEALLSFLLAHPDARLSELAAVLAESDERQRAAELDEKRQTRHQMLKRARRQAVGATLESVESAGGAAP